MQSIPHTHTMPMLDMSADSIAKHALLAVIAGGLAYALLGKPPGALSMINIGGSYAKLVHCLLIGLLVVLADIGLDYLL